MNKRGMRKINKFLLYSFIPFILVVLALFLIPKNPSMLISLTYMALFLLTFMNIFFQLWRMDKHSKGDPELKNQIKERTLLLKVKSIWVFIILFGIFSYILYFLMKFLNLEIYLMVVLEIIFTIIYAILYNNFRKRNRIIGKVAK